MVSIVLIIQRGTKRILRFGCQVEGMTVAELVELEQSAQAEEDSNRVGSAL